MDLTGLTDFKTTYSLDPDTDVLTVTFLTLADVVLGTIVIENNKYKAIMEALALISTERVTPLMEHIRHRVFYAVQTNEAMVSFG